MKILATGMAGRDYVHVWSLAKAHTTTPNCSMNHHKKIGLTVVNLDYGSGVTVRGYVERFSGVADVCIEIGIEARRSENIAGAHIDTSCANQTLGWHPVFTLEEGMRNASSLQKYWQHYE